MDDDGKGECQLPAPLAGRYTLSASMDGVSTTVPLLIEDDVMHVETDMTAANAYAARATGGAVSSDPEEVARLIRGVIAKEDERITHPMRSWWWVLPFTALLCAEWALRRHSGLQ